MSELIRQIRVIDMMTSMHSMLYEKYKRIALVLDIFLIVASICLNAFVFVDPAILKFIGLTDKTSNIIIGVSSILIFSISIVLFRVNLKEKARSHKDAVTALSRLKVECKHLKNTESLNDTLINSQIQKYSDTVSFLPKIPNSKFNKLKRKHEIKVLISKTISKHPGLPIWLIRWKFFKKHYSEIDS